MVDEKPQTFSHWQNIFHVSFTRCSILRAKLFSFPRSGEYVFLEGGGGEYIMSPWSEMISQTVNQCREVPRANKISVFSALKVVARKASKR